MSFQGVSVTPSGLPHSELKVGMLVTVSASKRTGDRSLANAIWSVAGLNDGHVLLTFKKFDNFGTPSRLVLLDEFEFYAAEALSAAADNIATDAAEGLH